MIYFHFDSKLIIWKYAFSDGDVPQIDVSPVVSNRNQENRWLKIMIDTMDYTNIYRWKNPNDSLKPKTDKRWWRPALTYRRNWSRSSWSRTTSTTMIGKARARTGLPSKLLRDLKVTEVLVKMLQSPFRYQEGADSPLVEPLLVNNSSSSIAEFDDVQDTPNSCTTGKINSHSGLSFRAHLLSCIGLGSCLSLCPPGWFPLLPVG